MLFQHSLSDRLGLVRLPACRLVRDHLEPRVFIQNRLNPGHGISRGSRCQITLHDGDFTFATAGFGHVTGLNCAHFDPIHANIRRRRGQRGHVDLHDKNTCLFGLFDQPGIGGDVRVMHHDHVWFLGDQLGQGLGPGLNTEIRVTYGDFDALRLQLVLQTSQPANGQIHRHRAGQKRDLLAFKRLDIPGAEWLFGGLSLRLHSPAQDRCANQRSLNK